MAISDKLLQVNQVKQDIKQAIENKGVDMTNVAFDGYAEKIDEIQTGGTGGVDVYSMLISAGLDYYKTISKGLYIAYNKDNLFEDAWNHSLIVDPSEIERTSTSSTQYGTLQYPNGEDNGVIIPDSVTSIGNYAFRNWEANNQPLVIPNSITSIGDNAFGYWTSNNQPLVIPNSITSIGNYAFRNWEANNQPLVIPNSITSIGDNAFRNWEANNQPLVIPNSVTSIGSSAFRSWLVNNQPLVIPNSVISIGNYAFDSWQSNNQQLVIPNSITSIGSSAFYYWIANNQPLVIPNSVTSIGGSAFSYWTNVPYVEMKSETPPTLSSSTAFSNQNDAPIYVPDASVTAYKNATNWSALASRIFSINDKP